MFLTSIHLENYRNYRRLAIDVGPSVNVFFGANAQGKTNIMESIYLCACARSHRTARDRDMIMHGEKYYKVSLNLLMEDEKIQESVSILYEEGDEKKSRRVAYHNHVPFEKISEYVGIFHAVIFAPEDLQLVKEGPSVRRRYMDMLISQVKPSYFYNLSVYSRLLSQRNRVLKNFRQRGKIHTLSEEEKMELDIWDYPLSETGGKIIADRIHYSLRIREIAENKHRHISNKKESLKIVYKTLSGISVDSLEKEPLKNEKNISDIFLKRLVASRQDDYERGATAYGPHRDDLELFLNNENLKLYASQGQQRSAALSLKLAELVILKEETKKTPILLLDDVFSELDGKRRKCLLDNIDEAQIFITCTDRYFLETILQERKDLKERDIRFFEICEGEAFMV